VPKQRNSSIFVVCGLNASIKIQKYVICMVSKSQIKFIRQLAQKKQRDQHDLFVAEGHKVVQEFINENYQLHQLFTLDLSLFSSHQAKVVSQSEMKTMSALKTPTNALAVFAKPDVQKLPQSKLILALESIQDPGNLGTIIRLCDWFGIQDIVCSSDTVDCYNPKVVRSTMGSLARVQVLYKDLQAWLARMQDCCIVATSMGGQSVYEFAFDSPTVLVIGNEGRGLSKQMQELATDVITIPRYGGAESLNAAMATGIIVAEARRKNY
jgi:TrmH family RNA methyltransferase